MSGRRIGQRPVPTIPEALSRLTLDADKVCGEVRQLWSAMKVFGPISERPYPENMQVEDVMGLGRGATRGTLEPKNEIKVALEDTEGQDDPAAQMRVIRAATAKIDGALTDLRAIRAMFEDIVQQPEVLGRVRQRIRKKGR